MNDRAKLVLSAQQAFRQGGDTRMLKRQLAKGNPYALAMLANRGLAYDAVGTFIYRKGETRDDGS